MVGSPLTMSEEDKNLYHEVALLPATDPLPAYQTATDAEPTLDVLSIPKLALIDLDEFSAWVLRSLLLFRSHLAFGRSGFNQFPDPSSSAGCIQSSSSASSATSLASPPFWFCPVPWLGLIHLFCPVPWLCLLCWFCQVPWLCLLCWFCLLPWLTLCPLAPPASHFFLASPFNCGLWNGYPPWTFFSLAPPQTSGPVAVSGPSFGSTGILHPSSFAIVFTPSGSASAPPRSSDTLASL